MPPRKNKPETGVVMPAAKPIIPGMTAGLSPNPLNPVPEETPILQQLGATGIKQYNGLITEEFLVQLRGKEAIKIFGEMEANDGIISAMVYACGMLIRTVEWRVEAVDDSEQADQAKEFVEQCMQDMSHSWPEFLEELTSYLTFGYSLFEIVYKVRRGPDEEQPEYRSRYSDNRIGWRKFAPRSQDSIERWLFNNYDDSLLGVVQQTETGKYAVIPIERLLLFRTFSRKNNPEGRSILRSAYVSYIRKRAVEDAEGRAALRAAGLVVMRLPGVFMSADADDEQKMVYNTYKTLATTLSRDQQGAVILPADTDASGKYVYDISYMIGDARRPADMSPIIERHNKTMATSILADFIFLGQSGVGSFALSSDKTDLFSQALGAYMRGIEDVLNRHALPRLWKLNNFDPEVMPKIKAAEIERPDIERIANYLSTLASAGARVFPDDELEQQLREMAELPPVADTAKTSVEANAESMQQTGKMNANQQPGGKNDRSGNGGASK